MRRRARLVVVVLAALVASSGTSVALGAVNVTSGARPLSAPTAQPSSIGASMHHASTPAAPGYDTSSEPCPPTASACVDIAAGKAWLQRDGRVVRGPVPISTGTSGHPTRTGSFKVAWKAKYTTSTIYGLPMPYAVFFATGGIAFHQGPLDQPSHGCVHLGAADAQAFFAALKVDDQVVVW